MKTPQFFYEEFIRLLKRAACGNDFLHCLPRTREVLDRILSTDYPEQEDDVEFLMDMVNCEMRRRNYSGRKRRFPAARILDQLCREPLYISMH